MSQILVETNQKISDGIFYDQNFIFKGRRYRIRYGCKRVENSADKVPCARCGTHQSNQNTSQIMVAIIEIRKYNLKSVRSELQPLIEEAFLNQMKFKPLCKTCRQIYQ